MEKNLTASKEHLSEIVTYSRAFALVSIVSAHIQFSDTAPAAITQYYRMIGSIGVILFMIVAGYYYNPKHYGSFGGMLKRKLKTVVLPWFCLGSVGFFYNGILSRNLSVSRYVNFLLGNGSYLYYLSMLILCFLLFYCVNSRSICMLAVVINVVSLFLTQAGLMESVIVALGITNYLNPLNWIGFFAAGMLLHRVDTDTICHYVKQYRVPTIVVVVTTYIFAFCRNIPTGYFSAIGWLIELGGAACMISLASFIPENCKIVKKISGYSYTVYLVHYMVIGLFDGVYNLAVPLQAAANLIVIAIAVMGIDVCLFIAKKVKLERLAMLLLGVRKG